MTMKNTQPKYLENRAKYIPEGALAVRDKLSDAIAYIFTDRRNRPCARVFTGRREKPRYSNYFGNEVAREASITRRFTKRRNEQRQSLTIKAEQRKPHSFAVGDILDAVFAARGYYIEFYEVTKVNGKQTITLRQLDSVKTYKGDNKFSMIPKPGQFTGAPITRRVNRGSVAVNDNLTATKWSGKPRTGSDY